MKQRLGRCGGLLSYGFWGAATTLVNYAVYFSCEKLLHWNILTSNVLAWAVSVAFAFVVNKTLVFASRSWAGATVFRELWQFVSARLLSGVLETAALVLFVQVLGFDSDAVKIIAGILVILANYALSKWVIFRKKPLG